MKYVSKEEYDKAVNVIYAYNEQIEKKIAEVAIKMGRVKSSSSHLKYAKRPRVSSYAVSDEDDLRIANRFNFDLNSVRTNDFIYSVKTQSKHITKGEAYKVIEANNGPIKIIDNSGVVKVIGRDNKFRLWSVVGK